MDTAAEGTATTIAGGGDGSSSSVDLAQKKTIAKK